jgi:hypothetical protein
LPSVILTISITSIMIMTVASATATVLDMTELLPETTLLRGTMIPRAITVSLERLLDRAPPPPNGRVLVQPSDRPHPVPVPVPAGVGGLARANTIHWLRQM